MKQADQIPDTRKQFDQFMQENELLTLPGIIDMIQISTNQFYDWKNGYPSSLIENKVRFFLIDGGTRFLEISKQLKTAKKDRVALHQERAAILQKARIHVPSKRRVPSPTINN